MKILMVLTSHDQLGNTGRKTGFWLEEFAAPYFVFRDAGVELTLASPKGGQPPLDPKSDLPENQTPPMTRFKPPMTRFKQDTAAQKHLSRTVKLSDMKSEDFDSIFYRRDATTKGVVTRERRLKSYESIGHKSADRRSNGKSEAKSNQSEEETEYDGYKRSDRSV
jgi:hypothetical protein